MKSNLRMRAAAYALCMLLGAAIAAALFGEAVCSKTLRLASVHPAGTVAPLMGFAADSVFNTGTAAELDALPGIGEVLSGRIIQARAEYGPYRLPEDLLLVKGIGPKTLGAMMDALPESLVPLAPAKE